LLDPRTWRVQSELWIWEMHMLRGGPDDQAAGETALANAMRAAKTPLETNILAMIRGDADVSAVISSASGPLKQCCAHYYIGAKAVVERRTDRARDSFQNCIATNAHESPEFHLACWHLAQLKDR